MKKRLIKILKGNKYLISGIAFLSLLFLIFYPTKYISIDENQYLANSVRILTGKLETSCTNISEYPGLHESKTGECVSKYNLGASLLLTPSILLGEQYAFVILFISFILSAIIFSRIIRLLELNEFLVILYIFYPPFIYFSRTLFSETFSLLFINLFLYAFINAKSRLVPNILTGLIIGFATLIRYTNLLIFIAFIIGYVIYKKEYKRVVYIALGAIPPGIIIMLINKDLYGSLFASGYSLSGEEVFSLTNIVHNLPRYLMLLLTVYPFMLLALPLFKNRLKWAFVLPVGAVILLYSMYPYNFFEGKITDFVVSGRVLMPIIPLVLLPFLYFLNNKISFTVKVIIVFLLVLSTCIVTIFHHNFLNSSQVVWESPTEFYLD